MCFASKNPHLSVVVFFESNIFLFCPQPRIITCIMYFVGVQILCQQANKLTNVNFSRHYTKFINMCVMCLKMPNLVKTLNLFFLQYDVLLRTPSLPSRAYLVHFVRQYLCF